jgi:hypothetical protein
MSDIFDALTKANETLNQAEQLIWAENPDFEAARRLRKAAEAYLSVARREQGNVRNER